MLFVELCAIVWTTRYGIMGVVPFSGKIELCNITIVKVSTKEDVLTPIKLMVEDIMYLEAHHEIQFHDI